MFNSRVATRSAGHAHTGTIGLLVVVPTEARLKELQDVAWFRDQTLAAQGRFQTALSHSW